MKIGISSACCYPNLLENTVALFCQHPIPVTELFLNTESEFQKSFLLPIRHQFDAVGTQVCSVHPYTAAVETFLFFSDYERRFQDGLELLRRFADSMHVLDTDILVLHGCANYSKLSDELVFQRFALMRDTLKREGIILAQENVAPFRSHDLSFLLKMREALDGNISFVLDIKQAVRSCQDPFEMAEKLGQNVVHLHLSDHREGADCLPVGKGNFDFKRLFRILKRQNYKGNAVLELYRENYEDYQELFDSQKTLQQMANSIK